MGGAKLDRSFNLPVYFAWASILEAQLHGFNAQRDKPLKPA
jgi:hypothetical protein